MFITFLISGQLEAEYVEGLNIKLEMLDMISTGKPSMVHNQRKIIHFLILVKDMDLQKSTNSIVLIYQTKYSVLNVT